MLDLIREIGQTLRNNRLRTSLTGLAVAWGIFMLIVLLGAARGVINAFNANDNASANNTIMLWPGRTTMPYGGYKEGRFIQMKGSDMEPLVQQNEAVSQVAATASVDTVTISTIKDYITGGFEAVFPREIEVQQIPLTEGRFVNDRDIEECRRSMVLNLRNARHLFGDAESYVGRTVKCFGLAWTVVGVYDHNWRTSSYTPYTTYKLITGNNDNVEKLTVTVQGLSTEADGMAAEADIRATMGRLHSFNPADESAIWTWNRFTQALANQAASGYLNLAVWIIGIFTLLSGIVGVSNIMFVSVRERTHEIGIRRAIGAKPRSILLQVIAESVAITTIFGYIGVVLGMAVLQVVDMLFGNAREFQNPTVDISIAVQVTAALIIAGSLAGLFPALKAIKVKPVEALRDE